MSILQDFVDLREYYGKNCDGVEGPLNSYRIARSASNPDNFVVWANFGHCHDFAVGIDRDQYLAINKALAEAIERAYSMRPPKHQTYAKPSKLHSYLNPTVFIPLDDTQAELYGLIPFSHHNRKLHWVEGEMSLGGTVYVPTDMVYYDYPSKDRLYWGNSSGVAAHLSRELATKAAIAELIERDAIMRTWFYQTAPAQVFLSGYPRLQARQDYWRDQGRRLFIFHLESTYGNVYLAAIVGSSWPAFVCGAAATLDADIESAMEKAVGEAELNFDSTNLEAKIPADRVCTPEEHGLFYANPDNLKYVEYLWSSEATDRSDFFVLVDSLDTLRKKLDVSLVWLNGDDEPLKVVRAFSPRPIPISFGSLLLHDSHPAVDGERFKAPQDVPHFFS